MGVYVPGQWIGIQVWYPWNRWAKNRRRYVTKKNREASMRVSARFQRNRWAAFKMRPYRECPQMITETEKP